MCAQGVALVGHGPVKMPTTNGNIVYCASTLPKFRSRNSNGLNFSHPTIIAYSARICFSGAHHTHTIELVVVLTCAQVPSSRETQKAQSSATQDKTRDQHTIRSSRRQPREKFHQTTRRRPWQASSPISPWARWIIINCDRETNQRAPLSSGCFFLCVYILLCVLCFALGFYLYIYILC